ncbi:aminotransferase class V-fold PLP-dependent enzyme [Corynebacterium sp. 20_84]
MTDITLPRPDIDADGLLEYSAVFSDRSLNHMSAKFIGIMQEIQAILRETYHAESVAVVPGGGTFAMESVARQFTRGKDALVIRTGNFSHRWTQIFDASGVAGNVTVLNAEPTSDDERTSYAPPAIDAAVERIRAERPAVVFAAHVETAAGLELPVDYISKLADAAHDVDALMVLDCVASGTKWINMEETGVDVLISAPQKGWSGSPATGYVMFSKAARAELDNTTSDSFAMDLAKWTAIAEGYVDGSAAYHATVPTDAIAHNLELMKEAKEIGLDELTARQVELGTKVRELLAEKGFSSVAAPGFEATSIVVMHADSPEQAAGAAFKQAGIQVAGGVPLQIGEPESFSTFRIGLFGLDKWADVDGTVARFAEALDKVIAG